MSRIGIFRSPDLMIRSINTLFYPVSKQDKLYEKQLQEYCMRYIKDIIFTECIVNSVRNSIWTRGKRHKIQWDHQLSVMLFTVFPRMKSEKFIVGKIFIFTTQDETEIKLFALKRWGCRIILCDVLEAHELTKPHALPGLLCTETFCLLFSAVNVLIALYCATPGLVVYYT